MPKDNPRQRLELLPEGCSVCTLRGVTTRLGDRIEKLCRSRSSLGLRLLATAMLQFCFDFRELIFDPRLTANVQLAPEGNALLSDGALLVPQLPEGVLRVLEQRDRARWVLGFELARVFGVVRLSASRRLLSRIKTLLARVVGPTP